MNEPLLVVAGEASGDRMAAGVVAALEGVSAFGLGGAALAAAGADLVCPVSDVAAMGTTDVAARACDIATAHARILREIDRRKPAAALLVDYAEYNARLAPRIHARGIRVLWYGAPQIWAWRPERALSLRKHIDRMAVILPFEEALWRSQGVDAHYVGHPAMEATRLRRDVARRALGITPLAPALAILPGSRPAEVRRLLGPMLAAFELVKADRASIDASVLLAPSLDGRTRSWAVKKAEESEVSVYDVDATTGAGSVLTAFDAAFCASGTASLEAALGRAIPVIVYRVDLLTEVVARLLLRSRRIALPNIVLGRDAFPELVQRAVRPKNLAEALERMLSFRAEYVEACDEVEGALGDARTPSKRVARMLSPWLGVKSPAP